MTDPIMLQRARELLDCLSDLQTQVEKKAVEDSKFWVEIVTELDSERIKAGDRWSDNNRFYETRVGSELNLLMLKRMLEIRNKIANHHIHK